MPVQGDTSDESLGWRGELSRRAWARPALNGIYLRDLQPRIGADLAVAIDDAPLWDLFSHEFGHGAMGHTATGLLLRNLYHAIYLLLYELDDDLRLHLPAWRLEGNERLAAIAPRLRSLLISLEPVAALVDETFCTLLTLLHRRRLFLTGQMPEEVYRAGLQEVEENSDRGVLAFCAALIGSTTSLGAPWFVVDDLDDVSRVLILLHDIVEYALNPPPEALCDWWKKGGITLPYDPWSRFANALNRTIGARSLEEAASRLAFISPHVAAGKPIASSFEVILERWIEQLKREDPDPYLEVVEALGISREIERTTHPIGRAVIYLASGQRTRQSDPVKQMYSRHGILSIITRDEDRFDCHYEARIPLGAAAEFVLRPSARQQIWQRFPGGKNFAAFGRLTILPASPEVELLWHLDVIASDLLTTGQLRCLCGKACRPEQACPCATLLARIHRHIESDGGTPLPAPACIAV